MSLIPVAQLESPPCSPICIAVMGDVALIQHGDIPGSLIPFSNDSLLLIDLKQALRSVVVRELESSIQEVTTELLLIPVPFECSLQEASVLLMHLPQLEKLGCLIRPFGPQSFLIEGVPTNFSGLDLPKFILDLVHEGVISNHHQMKEEKNKRLANAYVATMKDLRHPISSETALSIFRRWAQHDFPRLSPDGRPCFSQLTQTELKELISKGSSPTIEKQRR